MKKTTKDAVFDAFMAVAYFCTACYAAQPTVQLNRWAVCGLLVIWGVYHAIWYIRGQ